MTEDEAKEKWCPFVRAVTGVIAVAGKSTHDNQQPPYNRVVDGTKWAVPQGACCIASACMAWRLVMTFEAPDDPAAPLLAKPAGHGYCGLAGIS